MRAHQIVLTSLALVKPNYMLETPLAISSTSPVLDRDADPAPQPVNTRGQDQRPLSNKVKDTGTISRKPISDFLRKSPVASSEVDGAPQRLNVWSLKLVK